jgi:hypothetical protein
VTDFTVLEQRQQLPLVDAEIHPRKPGAQERNRVVGTEVGPRPAVPDVALGDHALDDLQDRRGVGPGVALARSE